MKWWRTYSHTDIQPKTCQMFGSQSPKDLTALNSSIDIDQKKSTTQFPDHKRKVYIYIYIYLIDQREKSQNSKELQESAHFGSYLVVYVFLKWHAWIFKTWTDFQQSTSGRPTSSELWQSYHTQCQESLACSTVRCSGKPVDLSCNGEKKKVGTLGLAGYRWVSLRHCLDLCG